MRLVWLSALTVPEAKRERFFGWNGLLYASVDHHTNFHAVGAFYGHIGVRVHTVDIRWRA